LTNSIKSIIKDISHEGYVSHEWGMDVVFFMALDGHSKKKKSISRINSQVGLKRLFSQ
jgi:hypothetical protein